MNPEDLHPELRKGILGVPNLPFASARLLPLTRFVFNLASRTKPRDSVEVETHKANGVVLRIFRPKGRAPKAGLLWIHGGGHIVGKPRSLDAVASEFADQLGVLVVAPAYRLAPKNPYPADLEDCRAAWEWLASGAAPDDLGDRLAIVGNSAGGGLATALVQQLRDEDRPLPKAQVLFYPMLDDRTATQRELDEGGHFIWSNAANRAAWSAYLNPLEPGHPEVPAYAAPGRAASLEGLPPTWIGAGDLDLFWNEIVDYADRLEAAGVEREFVRVPGAPHAFEAIVPNAEVSRTFVASASEFLSTQLGLGSS